MRSLAKHHLVDSKNATGIFVAAFLLCLLPVTSPAGDTLAGDSARMACMEAIDLIGYGVVIGLNGTGDSDAGPAKETMAVLLKGFDIAMSPRDIKSKSVANVIVIASVLPSHRPGDSVDVQVFALGDATSLEGGLLLMASLLGPSNTVYAVAQGKIELGSRGTRSDGETEETATESQIATGLVHNAAVLKQTAPSESPDISQATASVTPLRKMPVDPLAPSKSATTSHM